MSGVSAYGTNQRDCITENFCLIFVPFGHYDEPEILRYAINSICPKGTHVRH